MKHYLDKIKLAGAGYGTRLGGDEAEVVGSNRTIPGVAANSPIYRPPKLGDMQYGASFSFLETLDLVSDGPIEGVVNQQGRLVNNDGELLQGIYLDDTPVAITTEPEDQAANVIKAASLTGVIPLTGFFTELQNKNPNDLRLDPKGQQASSDGSLAPNWNFKSEMPLVFTKQAGQTAPNSFTLAQVARHKKGTPVQSIDGGPIDEGTPFDGELKATSLTIRNDFTDINLFMGRESSVGDNTIKKVGASITVNYTVTVQNVGGANKYFIDGVQQPTLELTEGNTYVFDWSAATSHPVRFSTTSGGTHSGGSEYTIGVTKDDSSYKTTIVVAVGAPTLYYYCQYHGGMGGQANTPTVDPITIVQRKSSKSRQAQKRAYMLYADTETATTTNQIASDYKFLFSFGNLYNSIFIRSNGSGHINDHFGGKIENSAMKLASILLPDVKKITNLFNKGIQDKSSGGKYQAMLAKKALDLLDSELSKNLEEITPSNDNDLIRIISKFLAFENYGTFIVYKPDEDQDNLLNLNLIDEQGPIVNLQSDNYEYKTLRDYNFRFTLSNGDDLTSFARQNASLAKVFDFLVPQIDGDGKLTGKINGFYLIAARVESSDAETPRTKHYNLDTHFKGISNDIVSKLSNISSIDYLENLNSSLTIQGNVNPGQRKKFNYSNVLVELKKGTENQTPFKFFKNIYIDKNYNNTLFGPFRLEAGKNVQRITSDAKMLSPNEFNVTVPNNEIEGSVDARRGENLAGGNVNLLNYSDWAAGLNGPDEEASPITHTIYNPNIEEVFVTLSINQLKDTLHVEVTPEALANDESIKKDVNKRLAPASSYPALLEVRISTGIIDGKTKKKIPNGEVRDYKFVALVNSTTLVDLGNPESSPTDYPWVKIGEFTGRGETNNKINQPIKLPPAIRNKTAGLGEEDNVKPLRYVEVTKLSCETNSVLLARDVSINKVTEIIPVDLIYPFSAIIGTKIDSRTIEGVPSRNFDCKLKLVKVPSNYFPLNENGEDKRYYNTKNEFEAATKEEKRVYLGDWDGTFKDELQWTDNPAWVIYDLLSNNRYGLGQHIDEETINKWELYKIARFCDSVNEDGIFQGVPDGQGGIEPRFSCNVVFKEGEKIYDAINTVVGLFRGSVYYGNNEINFVDDRPRTPVNLITNESVKDGSFSYSNNRRDETFNTIEISYKDRFENFLPKIETVENEKDIRERGVFKTRIEGVGITSRAMARRAALHHMFHKIEENQTVNFTAGLPTLLAQPGDLITIEDELKSNVINFGRILSVDAENETIRISNTFETGAGFNMTGRLTVYDPTGIDTIDEISETAETSRQRILGGFTITGNLPSSPATWPQFTGEYNFSGYTDGYQSTGSVGFAQYAQYTGTGNNILYFDSTLTGWVFATGKSFSRNNNNDKWINSSTTIHTLADLSTGVLNDYDASAASNRGSQSKQFNNFSGNIFNPPLGYTKGILDSEINVASPSQLKVITVTGGITPKIPINQNYGTLVSGVDNPSLLSSLIVGTPCKFEISGATPFTYKVLEIKEANPNEYSVTASLYDTGKYDLIENNISIQTLPNTHSYQSASASVNNFNYFNLKPVTSLAFETGADADNDTFFISGSWSDPNGANSLGYDVILNKPENTIDSAQTTEDFHIFSGLDSFGDFTFKVIATGDTSSTLNAYFNSSPAVLSKFLIFNEALSIDKSFVKGFTIL